MSNSYFHIVLVVIGLFAFAYYLDIPKHISFERAKLVETTKLDDGETRMRVRLSNRQEHDFVQSDPPKSPLVNYMICVNIKRGGVTGRLNLEMVRMEDCPLPFAENRGIRSKPNRPKKTEAGVTKRLVGKPLPGVGQSLNNSN